MADEVLAMATAIGTLISKLVFRADLATVAGAAMYKAHELHHSGEA